MPKNPDSRPRIGTLKSGEKTQPMPDGSRRIVPTGSLAATLAATDDAMREAESAVTAARIAAVEAKREALIDGDEVPAEKRVV